MTGLIGVTGDEDDHRAPALDQTPAPPIDADEWRALFASLPPRDLVRLAQKDKDRSARLFAGFRPAPELLRNPIVLTRFVEEARKRPKFGDEVLEIKPSPPPEEGAFLATSIRVSPNAPADKAENAPSSERRGRGGVDAALKVKLDAHRKALREKDERIRALEAALADAQRERETVRAAAEASHAARVTAEAEAERQRHRRERETRRMEQKAMEATLKGAGSVPSAPGVATGAAMPDAAPMAAAALFEDAMRRLLSRGRYALVVEVCREALLLLGDDAGRAIYGRRAEGVIRSLTAESLAATPTDRYSQERQRQESEEQERFALAAFLEAGDVAGAAESWGRLVARRLSGGIPILLKPNDAALLARIAALMERTGQAKAVRAAFDRVRVASPEVTGQLQALFGSGGKKLAPLLAVLAPVGGGGEAGVRPDEAISLPTMSAVTARRILKAVDTGDAEYIRNVRSGLRALRERGREGDAALAERLESAVAALNPAVACPLLQRNEPRPILVDASNVARHDPDPLALAPRPRVAVLRQMRDFLLRGGWFPVLLIADANLRFHVDDKPGYLLLVEAGIVQETPPGTVADTVLIREAESLPAPLVTNDRLADYGDAARRIRRFGFLLFPGGVTLTDG
ncbi:MAG: hypothetical protein H7Z41_08785 [Cytophagales bacterium]|nr:hypothetical protein [Armatimonadota bacterium]